jgi:predicted SAM-dependent methyltransferase
MASGEPFSSIKAWLKANRLYGIARKAKHFLMSLPYVLQTARLPSKKHNLMLGHAGKLDRWVTVDKLPGADFMHDIRDLSLFASNSMDCVYASHVLEHLNCEEAKAALKEMHRVLIPSGEIFVVVPDLVAVSKLLETEFVQTAVDILYGVQRASGEFHSDHEYGYTKELLSQLLTDVGFTEVKSFDPFIDDTSRMRVNNVLISLCLTGAKKVIYS